MNNEQLRDELNKLFLGNEVEKEKGKCEKSGNARALRNFSRIFLKFCEKS